MTFIIGRGFAKRQILKKWKWPYLLNWVEYFDKLLRKHTKWNIVMKFCIHVDIDKMYPMRLSNDIWDWLSFFRGSNSEKKWDYCKITSIIGRGFAERQILKKCKWPYLLNLVEYIDRLRSG